MVVADFSQKGQNWRKPNKMLKLKAVNIGCMEECFFYSVVLQECLSSVRPNELEQWSRGLDLYSSHAGQSALFDGEADIKQLPL